MFQLIIILITLFLQGYPTAYFFTTTPPEANMQPLGPIGITFLVPENGQYVPRCEASNIEDYVIWVNPQREPMYWIKSGALAEMIEKDRLPNIECANPN